LMIFIVLALVAGMILFGGVVAMRRRSPPAHARMEESSSRKQREEGGGCGAGFFRRGTQEAGMPSVRNLPSSPPQPWAYPGVGQRSSPSTGVQPPPNPSRSPQQVQFQEPSGVHLCPELVVPEGSECTLIVPRLSGGGSSQVTVDDTRGVPVFCAAFNNDTTWQARIRETKRLILSSTSGDTIFAFCRDDEAQGGPSGLVIHHHSEAPFGVLHADSRDAGSGYTLVARQGFKVHIKGDHLLGNMNVTDESGRLLAIATPLHQGGGAHRSLRIGPLVDAGLVALGLLGIDFLEHQRTQPNRGR